MEEGSGGSEWWLSVEKSEDTLPFKDPSWPRGLETTSRFVFLHCWVLAPEMAGSGDYFGTEKAPEPTRSGF